MPRRVRCKSSLTGAKSASLPQSDRYVWLSTGGREAESAHTLAQERARGARAAMSWQPSFSTARQLCGTRRPWRRQGALPEGAARRKRASSPSRAMASKTSAARARECGSNAGGTGARKSPGIFTARAMPQEGKMDAPQRCGPGAGRKASAHTGVGGSRQPLPLRDWRARKETRAHAVCACKRRSANALCTYPSPLLFTVSAFPDATNAFPRRPCGWGCTRTLASCRRRAPLEGASVKRRKEVDRGAG